MKKVELTEEQLIILDEIRQLVIVGEHKLKEFNEESAAIEAKWRQREAKRAAAQRQE